MGAWSTSGWAPCVIEGDVRFSTKGLESYCLGNWEPLIYDALLLPAAIEYCDRALARREFDWPRSFELRLPVHDPDRWNEPALNGALVSALEHLTGDFWTIDFVARRSAVDAPRQTLLGLPSGVAAILPYSDGLDSRAVGGLLEEELRGGLIRVRLGSVGSKRKRERELPFAKIPYEVVVRGGTKESSGRSRGFKFAMVAGVGAYLVGAPRIIMPESAQGALGPVLVPVGQAHEDYRNHPEFTALMVRFLKLLFARDMQFEFPRLWHTKGETLKAYATLCGGQDFWTATRSCWQQSRQVSWGGRRRQCGICAACLLRRMSMNAAGLRDLKETFIWQDLSSPEFKNGAVPGFARITGALREYAIAGLLHLKHLAALTGERHAGAIDHHVFKIARALGVAEDDVRRKLMRVLNQHRQELDAFMDMVGSQSFLAGWASCTR
jgi:hypothetical protein